MVKRPIFTILFLFLFLMPAWAGTIKVEWDANQEPDLAGYNLYYWEDGVVPIVEQMVDVGNATAYEITGLTTGTFYIIEATAYDTSNNESERTVYGVRAKARFGRVTGLGVN